MNGFHFHPYADMLYLTPPISPTRHRMSMSDRAAQFAPFAALVGYEDALTETARITEQRIELDEQETFLLDRILQYLHARIAEAPEVSITYFCPDSKKDGGSYITVTGRLKQLRPLEKRLILEDGTAIPLADIRMLDSPLLETGM